MAKSQTILITGCSADGIGAVLALTLAKQHHRIFATARDTSKIPFELRSLPNVSVIALDVSSKESVAEAAKAVEEAGHCLDVLVNNAGFGYTMPILDVDIDKAQNLYNANVWGMSTRRGLLLPGTYASSKAAINSISETLRLELSPFGVSVVTILLGTVATPFHANEPIPELPETSYYAKILETITKWAKNELGPKGGSTQELVNSIVPDIMASNRNGIVWRGSYSGIIWFVTRWLPVSILDMMMSQDQGLDELAKT
ncbi:hypothetical protein THARTR1_00208 [Trichoderma harzianum]|uniref:NADPH-dependent 1-acyldihydroxyacetone phosphate reductase n=1 Tax=Trichoderma harzianum TaxID=5544 RepID=A0A2K0UQY2_TRIHA|nr:hypothetical protein THARTR1_00208 [Trichoderma harzianum]